MDESMWFVADAQLLVYRTQMPLMRDEMKWSSYTSTMNAPANVAILQAPGVGSFIV